MLALTLGTLLLVGCAEALFQPEQFMTPMQIIRYHGYPAEEHHTVTQDGYILTLHRIPHGKTGNSSVALPSVPSILQHGLLGSANDYFLPPPPNSQNSSGIARPAILLQHGLLSSSFDFLSLLPEKSLSYFLADSGYDVWIGNNRGNLYSNSHVKYSWFDERFWNFTFDEMARFDTHALVDYILNTTTNQTGIYVGALTFMAEAAQSAELSGKIKHFFALSPALATRNMQSVIIKIASLFSTPLLFLSMFLPDQAFSAPILFPVCGTQVLMSVCETVWGDISGSTEQLDEERIPIYLSKIPGGTSKKNMIHWWQNSLHSTQRYDYGTLLNLIVYGNAHPAVYTYENYSVPTSVYFSPTDHLVSNEDMIIAFSLLPPSSITVKRNLTGFGHFDMIWGDRAKAEIYDDILAQLNTLQG